MPELPDVEAYLAALRSRVQGRRFERLRLASPFLLRSVDPAPSEAEGREIAALSRLGKRLVFELRDERFLVLHLMIAGRLHWRPRLSKIPGRFGLAAFDFETGCLILTEAGTRRRASLHVVRGGTSLRTHDPGGLEVLGATPAEFRSALRRESRTLKRALTDPRLFSGIGNAYSDEILHRARVSPLTRTSSLDDEAADRLRDAATAVLTEWRDRLVDEAQRAWPENVTAFREGMAVHGRYRKPCPDCGSPVQRIRYAENECNYCARCQTGGRLLADRSLSRLLKDDWPRTLDELENPRAS